MTLPNDVASQITPAQKIELENHSVRISGHTLTFREFGLQGYWVRLGEKFLLVGKDGIFTVDSIPTGVKTGKLFKNLSDKRPIVTFCLNKLAIAGHRPPTIRLDANFTGPFGMNAGERRAVNVHVVKRRTVPAVCPEKTRRLWDNHKVWGWEVEQAAELGWVRIFLRDSRGGPPTRVAEIYRRADANEPPPRRLIEKEISRRHEDFARRSVFECVPRGMKAYHFGRLPGVYAAYLRCYPKVRSATVAGVCASRLMRKRDVQAARAWFYAVKNRHVPREEEMPRTVSGIKARLREVGSAFAWRVA